MALPQTAAVSIMQRNYNAVLAKLANGPVHLMQHSKPVGVIVPPADYERMEAAEIELKRLRRILQADIDFAEMRREEHANSTLQAA